MEMFNTSLKTKESTAISTSHRSVRRVLLNLERPTQNLPVVGGVLAGVSTTLTAVPTIFVNLLYCLCDIHMFKDKGMELY